MVNMLPITVDVAYRWKVTDCADLVPRQVHVTPLADRYKHRLTLTCPCCPGIEHQPAGLVVIHNEMD